MRDNERKAIIEWHPTTADSRGKPKHFYPVVAATLLDSYRLPLIIQNLIFGNIVALLIICFISKRFVVRFD